MVIVCHIISTTAITDRRSTTLTLSARNNKEFVNSPNMAAATHSKEQGVRPENNQRSVRILTLQTDKAGQISIGIYSKTSHTNDQIHYIFNSTLTPNYISHHAHNTDNGRRWSKAYTLPRNVNIVFHLYIVAVRSLTFCPKLRMYHATPPFKGTLQRCQILLMLAQNNLMTIISI